MNKTKYIYCRQKHRHILTNRHYFIPLFIFLLKIVLVKLIIKKNKRNLNNWNSEIHLVIQGNKRQQILYSGFNVEPSDVLVNGISKGNECKKTCYLEGEKNNITLLFSRQIESCEYMFYNLKNIIEVDLSRFDASKVTSMYYMFFHCSNLEKINFGNINTSSLENMRSMFNSCTKLTSIDMSNFNTSKVTTMYSLFYQCKNLKYLDLSNFDTSKVIDIQSIFRDCKSLIFLNLYSFKLSNSVKTDYSLDGISSYVKCCINDIDIKICY